MTIRQDSRVLQRLLVVASIASAVGCSGGGSQSGSGVKVTSGAATGGSTGGTTGGSTGRTTGGSTSTGVSTSTGGSTTTGRSTGGSVGSPLAISTTTLPGGTQGAAYTATISASGGSGTGYGWSVTSGALPPGLTLGAGTPDASLAGTPSASGSYGFTVSVTDSAGATASQAFTMTIAPPATTTGPIRTVWVILMENHNWADISGSASAPYINNTLLPSGAHAEQYYNPPGNHPSEPNYIWLESGDNQGLLTDADPDPQSNHAATTQHLATMIDAAGLSWRTYQEDMPAGTCPISSSGSYACKHNPFVFFDDITGQISASDAYCQAHQVPYTASALQADLTAGNVASYTFVTPNTCDDMHDVCGLGDAILQGDQFLSQIVPIIQSSAAYQAGGAIFITWDEGEGGDGPIGMIVLSPKAKTGYSGTIHYDHSSTVKTVEEIFHLTPLIGHAADATTNDLSDLFTSFP